MKISILSLAAVFAITAATAQVNTAPKIHSLTIGEQVPDIVFDHMVNFASSSARLSNFHGKLIILDFWATWCSSCVNNFGHLDSLQRQFSEQLQVILVNSKATKDSPEKVQEFFRKLIKSQPGFRLPSAFDDTVADQIFTHKIIPHYVWIGSDGKILAFTSSDQVNESNIRSALEGVSVRWSMKNDWDMDKPLVMNTFLASDSVVHYSILLKGFCDGLPSGQHTHTKGGVAHGIMLSNTTIFDMYRTVIRNLPHPFKTNRILIEVKDPSTVFPDTTFINREAWYRKHCYSYDIMVPVTQAAQLYSFMLDDLNRYSGYITQVKQRPVECLIVKSSTLNRRSPDQIKPLSDTKSTKSTKDSIGLSITRFIDYLNDIFPIPIVDETYSSEMIRADLPNNLTDMTTLQRFLSGNGFKLVKEVRLIDMVILMDADQQF